MSPREVKRSSRMFKTTGDAEQALGELASAGIGRWEDASPIAKGGRPTRRLRLIDSVAVDETPLNRPDARPAQGRHPGLRP